MLKEINHTEWEWNKLGLSGVKKVPLLKNICRGTKVEEQIDKTVKW
jgi:hypothetical protein